jgi:Na+:H+ antiporter, NhaA family
MRSGTPIGFRVASFTVEHDLHFWINDGLMTVFFFVVGLEIRREIHGGELSELRRAALPAVAAVGGMLVPAGTYAALNLGGTTRVGWGVPMATDIAFAVGVLTLLGRRVTPAMRVLLLSLAVIDDVGAILVIAVFYGSGFAVVGMVIALLGISAIGALHLLGVRSPFAYVVPAFVVWAGALRMGIHPTLAGVVVGMMTPVRPSLGRAGFLELVGSLLDRLRAARSDVPLMHPEFDELGMARREAIAPAERLQHVLHPIVAYGIMPLFAFANAGVALDGVRFDGTSSRVFGGVALGLLFGKPAGVLLASWLAIRFRVAVLPRGLGLRHVGVVGLAAGIGFTMALFIAGLAFVDDALLVMAKLGIVAASIGAGCAALIVGRLVLPEERAEEGARTETEAEASTLM